MTCDLAGKTAALGRPCRHYSPLLFLSERDGDRSCCAKGHPIRQIVAAATEGEGGMLFKLPCRPGPDRAVDCPDYDPKTDAEVEADREATRAAMDKAMKMMAAAGEWRRKLTAAGKARGRASCPVCGGHETVSVQIALGYNGHMACHCNACRVGFRE